MSEGNPNGQRDNSELSNLLRELELQIDSVNAGLGKIRGTVARITYAALGTTTPTPASSWGAGLAGAPANRQEWQAVVVSDEPSVAPLAASPSPTFAADTPPPAAHPEPEHEPPAGFWDSIAEGASWPRAHANDVEPEPETDSADSFAWAGFHAAAQSEGAEPGEPESETPVSEEAVQPGTSSFVEHSEETASAEHSPASESLWLAEEPRGQAEEPAASSGQEGMPSALSSAWPDESAWSQSFEWPALKQDAAPERAGTPAGDDIRVDVSDIVAQVKAELAAARADGVPPSMDIEDAPGRAGDTPAWPGAETFDPAKRDEVSRAVAEMRQQIESGDFEAVMRGHGYDPASKPLPEAEANTPPEPPAAGPPTEEDVRAEVRRAVEATREELSTGREASQQPAEKPAFRLAAPSSLPDWSHMQMEPSGPPVVVMKDVDGRVELASVYETLNELGCGDGAALLNYTPHSVTVGLPVTVQVPSKERMSEAVEKVFGLSSRVESDGVRITVSIGVDPKRKSVDAA